MKIWIDADACPGVIKDIVYKAALKHGIETVLVANKSIFVPESQYLSLKVVAQGPDVADGYIHEHATSDDLVITQDIPLAGLLVPKGISVISPHGTLFTPSNIGERLAMRNLAQDLRDNGFQTGGPKSFSDKDKRQFANTFDQLLAKQLKNR